MYRVFNAGEVIIKEGEASDCAYVIETGSVRVSKMNPGGRETGLAVLHGPTIVGELGLIDGQPRSATVTALEKCTAVVVTAEYYKNMIASRPEQILQLLMTCADRTRNTLGKIKAHPA